MVKDINIKGKEDNAEHTSATEDEKEIMDWLESEIIKGDLNHLEDVVRILKEKGESDNGLINNQIQKTKSALRKFMEHSLVVLKVSSQNMNALVAFLEKDNQNKENVIIHDELASSSVQHSSRRRTRQNASELELKTKGNQQMQENKDLKEAANVMIMLVKDAEETINIFT